MTCKNPSTAAHHCIVCKQSCHAIETCSVTQEGQGEGFGAKVKCLQCTEAEGWYVAS